MEAVVNKKYPKDRQALVLFQYKSSLRLCVPFYTFSCNGRCGPQGVRCSRRASGHCSKKTVNSHFSMCLLESVNHIGSFYGGVNKSSLLFVFVRPWLKVLVLWSVFLFFERSVGNDFSWVCLFIYFLSVTGCLGLSPLWVAEVCCAMSVASNSLSLATYYIRGQLVFPFNRFLGFHINLQISKLHFPQIEWSEFNYWIVVFCLL